MNDVMNQNNIFSHRDHAANFFAHTLHIVGFLLLPLEFLLLPLECPDPSYSKELLPSRYLS